jgi:hypothetical protein
MENPKNIYSDNQTPGGGMELRIADELKGSSSVHHLSSKSLTIAA